MADKITDSSPKDYAIEFGRYLADAAEALVMEANRAAKDGDAIGTDYWRNTHNAIHQFRKRALLAEREILT